MRLIVGLGNPGRKYNRTWHNLGARVVEELAARWGAQLKPGRGDYYLADWRTPLGQIALMIPTSYMNRSGGPVQSWARYYKVPTDQILIVYDDHDLPLGRIRIRESGSSGGHRGLEDIICRLNTDLIPRLRIGIRTDQERHELRDQVLSKIPGKEKKRVAEIVDASANAVVDIIRTDLVTAMTEYNGIEIN